MQIRFPLFARLIGAMMAAPAMASAAQILNQPRTVRIGAKPSVDRLGRVHPTDNNGQHRNPAKARQRKLMRQLGGHRQFLKTTKELRRFKTSLALTIGGAA